ncbi:reverse transcriptase [Tanacetum coccineum]
MMYFNVLMNSGKFRVMSSSGMIFADDEMECEEEYMEEESSLPDELRMEFMYKNKIMTLRGTPKATIHWVQLMNVEGQAIKDMLDPKLTKVVDTFRDVFAVPIELPPQITYDHRIPLLPNTQPVNIRPYRNPRMHKDAIEVMVKELLASGVIKPTPPIHVPYLGGMSKVEAVNRTLKAREEAIQTIKFYLLRAQNKMKQQADKGSQPLTILDRRIVKKRNAVAIYGLVQWTNASKEDATWEPLDKLGKDYPEFDFNS